MPNTTPAAAAHEFVIDKAAGPGTILRDFDTLITLVNDCKPVLSGSGLLSMNLLAEINTRLARPIQIGLTRPRLVSYPHIEGLYTLLRSLGLTTTTQSGKKTILAVDSRMLPAWMNLNDTERYCTLLETWLLHATPVGDHSSSFGSAFGAIHYYAQLHTNGKRIAGDKDAESAITYVPGLYAVALLELFGIVEVVHGQPRPNAGWRIEYINRTTFGDELTSFLVKIADRLPWGKDDSEALGEVSFNLMQPLLSPCFPEWKRTLVIPKEPMREGIFVFKVTLGICRRLIAISATHTLDDLASAILDSVGFDYDHLYSFSLMNRLGTMVDINHPDMGNGPWADETLLGEIPLQTGQEMTFEYDFGDRWMFAVLLEKVDSETKIDKPRCIESHGAAPEQYDTFPED